METFVIQIPTPAEGGNEPSPQELRGVVEHVGSGRRQPFADMRELEVLLRAGYQSVPKEGER
jgi:hypothetical protein